MTAQSDAPAVVHVHVHLAVTGSFPLRVADVLFTDEAVVIPEYEHLTPLFGLVRSGVEGASATARERFRADGPAGLVELAERVHRIPYDDVTTVRLSHSRVSRPKLAVHVASEPPYGYRVHADLDEESLVAALRSLGDRRGFGVERRNAVGFSPVESVRRFLAGR